MTFSFRDPGWRSRRRAAEGRRRVFLLVFAAVAIAFVSYWRGAEDARSQSAARDLHAQEIEAGRAEMEKTILSLRADAQFLRVRHDQLKERYDRDVPSGALKDLMEAIRRQVASGIKPERLSAAILAARPPKNCTSPVVKRFVVKTSAYNGPTADVSFWNGVIRVAGTGASASAPDGSLQAWYDPGRPVTVTFTQTDGSVGVSEGLLPLQYSTVISGKEYRFTVAAGDRSFMTITSDSCDYP